MTVGNCRNPFSFVRVRQLHDDFSSRNLLGTSQEAASTLTLSR